MTQMAVSTASAVSVVPLDQVERMALAMAKSGLFGIKTPDQALALMLVAQAEGLHPATAARDFHIIGNRPALKADAMLARFLAAGGKIRWIEMTDLKVEAEFSHPQGGTVTVDWTAERAKRAGITNDMHRKYPRQMLRARVISEGIRTVFPGVAVGVYTPEEVQEFEQPERRERPVVSAAGPVEPAAPSADVDALLLSARAAAMRGTAAYRAHWAGLNAGQRRALSEFHPALKQDAEAADAQPVEDAELVDEEGDA